MYLILDVDFTYSKDSCTDKKTTTYRMINPRHDIRSSRVAKTTSRSSFNLHKHYLKKSTMGSLDVYSFGGALRVSELM